MTYLLGQVINALNNNQIIVAINQLSVFINQVEVFRTLGELTDDEADALISAAEWIIDNIENG